MNYFRCAGDGGKKSLMLPSNPEITLTKSGSNQVVVTWTKPSSEVTIAKYRVYIQNANPTDLSSMALVTETSSLTFTSPELRLDNTYYFVVTSVSEEGYENASIKKKKSIEMLSGKACLVLKSDASDGLYYSSDGINWQNIYEAAGKPRHVSYGSQQGIFYTDVGYGTVKPTYSTDGKNWYNITGLERPIPPNGEIVTNLFTPFGYPGCYYAFGFVGYGLEIAAIDKYGSSSSFSTSCNSSSIAASGLFSTAGSLKYISKISNNKFYINGNSTAIGNGNEIVRCVDVYQGAGNLIGTRVTSTGYSYIYYMNIYQQSSYIASLTYKGTLIDLCCKYSGSGNCLASFSDTAYYSEDGGATWTKITGSIVPSNCYITYDTTSDNFIAINNSNVYMCSNSDMATWERIGTPSGISGNIEYVIGK